MPEMRVSSALGFVILAPLAACGAEDATVESADAAGPDWGRAFADTDAWWLSVWGPSADRVYVAGGAPGAGRLETWDGSNWSTISLPSGTPLLNWVYGTGPDDVYAVGEAGTILHFDGSSWTAESSTTTEDLWGVWGLGPDATWAVGGGGRMAGQATLLKRSSDGTWKPEPVPALERAGVNAFYKVWGLDAAHVWVVGQRGAILAYDGAAWSETGAGTSEDLISLWGTSVDDVVAVGGRGNGVVARWDGASWTHRALAPLPGLNGVWTDTPGRVWAVGETGTVIRLSPSDGTWSIESLDLEGEARQWALHAVFGGAGRVLTVGGNFERPEGPYRGFAWTYSGEVSP